jgi:hypothetical protein
LSSFFITAKLDASSCSLWNAGRRTIAIFLLQLGLSPPSLETIKSNKKQGKGEKLILIVPRAREYIEGEKVEIRTQC